MKIILTLLVTVFLTTASFAQVGINNETPDASAALDITSTTGGLLVPRMTASQRNLITSPTQGLIIFCTDCASGEGELQVRLTSSWKNTSGGEVNDPPPSVGDFYQGGVVFYLFESGDIGYVEGEIHGLIAAAEDQYKGNNDSRSISWKNGSYVTTGATATAIGTGSSNTDIIISVQGATETYAAGLARAYNGGGFTDWFLPSKDELNKMYQKKEDINAIAAVVGDNLSDVSYWSSSETSNLEAWYQHFSNGYRNNVSKGFTFMYVRAVRAF